MNIGMIKRLLKKETTKKGRFKWLIGGALLLAPLLGNAQINTFPYTEGFNGSTIPTGWTQDYVTGTSNWAVVTTNGNNTITPLNGAGMAEFRATSWTDVTKLVTPELDITSLTVPYLEFYLANVSWDDDIDKLNVYYKTSATGTWVQLDQITAEHTSWTKYSYVLPNPTSTYYIAFEGISSYARGLDIDDVLITEGPALCAGSPSIGVANSDLLLVCPTDAFKLTIPSLNLTGLTYRWEASTDGGLNWNFISAASADTFLTVSNQTVNTEYRVAVYCGTDSTLSNVVTVNNKPLGDCYCVPVYTNGCTNGDSISNVQLGTFVNFTGGNCGTAEFLAPGYATYLSLTPGPELIRGDADTVLITNGSQGASRYAIWVDLNNNGVFETSEKVGFTTAASAANSVTKVGISVPASTAPGQYRMRIRLVRTTSGATMTACASYANGEAEDYILNIIDPPNCASATLPSLINAISDKPSVCVSDSVIFGISTTLPNAVGLTYQWESSTDGGTTWASAGAIKSITKDTLLVNTDGEYRLNVMCNATHAEYSNILTITAENPLVLSVTDSSRCGYGPVELEATASAGSILKWYASASGGGSIGTGTTFTTPNLSSTTTFYVAANEGNGGTDYVGIITPTSTSSFITTDWGILFDATTGFDLVSTTVYPTGTGTLTVALLDGADNLIYTAPAFTITNGTPSTPVVLPLNFSITPGSNYKLIVLNYTGVTNLVRELSGGPFPYNSANGEMSITGGYTGSASNAYYFFYNIEISTACESARQPVVATVTPPPAITATTTAATICKGSTTDLNVTSTNAGYTFEWMPGNLAGASQTVTPLVSTEYIVKAEDLTTGPNEGCVTLDTVSIRVDSVNVPPLIATPDTICSGEQVVLDVLQSVTIGQGALSVLNDDVNPFRYYFGGKKQQVLVLANELTAAGFSAGTNLNALGFDFVAATGQGFSNFALSIGHTTASFLSYFDWETGLVNVYNSASETPVVGVNMYNFSNTFIWDGVSNIVIQTCWSNNNTGSTNMAPTIKYDNTSFVSTTYYQDDNETASSICSEMYVDDELYERPVVILSADLSSSNLSFVWNPGGVTGLTHSVSPLNLTNAPIDETYTLTATDPVTNCVDSRPINIHVKPAVNAVITSPETVICSNDQLGFYIDGSIASTPGASFTWLTDGSTTPTFLVNQAGTYVLKATNIFGCSDNDTIVINSVNPIIPVISVNYNANSATLDAGAGFTSYLWSTLETTQTISVGNGTYTVETEDANGCKATSAPVTLNGIGLNENNSDVLVTLFPNPSNGIFTLKIDNLLSDNMRIDFMDINGRVISNMIIKEASQNFMQNFDLSNVADGTYFLKITTDHGSVTERIVIVK